MRRIPIQVKMADSKEVKAMMEAAAERIRQLESERDVANAQAARLADEMLVLQEWRKRFEASIAAYKAVFPNHIAAVPVINALHHLINTYEGLHDGS